MLFASMPLPATDLFRGKTSGIIEQGGLKTKALEYWAKKGKAPPGVTLLPGDGVYVSSLGNDANSGIATSSPVKNINVGVRRAAETGRSNIFIAKGIYSRVNGGMDAGADGILVNTGTVNLIGGCETNFVLRIAGSYSELDGGGSGRIISIADIHSVSCDGFVIRASMTAAAGGGIYVRGTHSVLLSNIIISNNTASTGAGIYLENSTNILIAKVTIQSNRGQSGTGGIAVVTSGNIVLDNIICAGNRGTGGGGGGAVILIDSTPVSIINCSISNNKWGGPWECAIELNYATTTPQITISGNNLTGDGSGAVIAETGVDVSGHSIINNISIGSLLTRLYREISGDIPLGSVLMLNTPGHAFHDAAAASGNSETP